MFVLGVSLAKGIVEDTEVPSHQKVRELYQKLTNCTVPSRTGSTQRVDSGPSKIQSHRVFVLRTSRKSSLSVKTNLVSLRPVHCTRKSLQIPVDAL